MTLAPNELPLFAARDLARPCGRAAALVNACRVPASIESRQLGLWEIRRLVCPPGLERLAGLEVGESTYTVLARATSATMHQDLGEIVMEDTRRELRRHLPILLAARGRVLVSGLGLGCVVRGLLSKPEVTHVDVVELDAHILELVVPSFGDDPRVSFFHGDALTIDWPASTRWDYAWHDIWSERESLELLHAELLARYRHTCRHQGVWQFPRPVKRAWSLPLLGQKRRDYLTARAALRDPTGSTYSLEGIAA